MRQWLDLMWPFAMGLLIGIMFFMLFEINSRITRWENNRQQRSLVQAECTPAIRGPVLPHREPDQQ